MGLSHFCAFSDEANDAWGLVACAYPFIRKLSKKNSQTLKVTCKLLAKAALLINRTPTGKAVGKYVFSSGWKTKRVSSTISRALIAHLGQRGCLSKSLESIQFQIFPWIVLNCRASDNVAGWSWDVHQQGQYHEFDLRGAAQPRTPTLDLLDPRSTGKSTPMNVSSIVATRCTKELQFSFQREIYGDFMRHCNIVCHFSQVTTHVMRPIVVRLRLYIYIWGAFCLYIAVWRETAHLLKQLPPLVWIRLIKKSFCFIHNLRVKWSAVWGRPFWDTTCHIKQTG